MTTRKRWLQGIAYAAGAALLLYALVWALVPPLLKWQGQAQATAALGRDVSFGRVTFVPWSLDLAFEDVQIGGAPSRAASSPSESSPPVTPLLTIGRVHVDVAAASLWRLAPVIQALEIDRLRLSVARFSPGRYDIDDLIQRFAPRTEAPPTDPLHFALYNVQLRDAAIRFDDRPASRVHDLTALHLAVPFLSNLPAQIDVKVEPHLSFTLNQVPFDSGALATPFAKTRAGELKLKFADLNLDPYLGYLPDALPVRVQAGMLSTDLTIEFALPPNAPPTFRLQGTLGVQNARLTDRQGAPLLAWRRLDLAVREAMPLARHVALSTLRVEGALLNGRRDADGNLNLLQLGAVAPKPSTPSAPPIPASSSNRQAKVSPPIPWRVELDRLVLADATLVWSDTAIAPAAALQIDRLNADLTKIQWPVTRPLGVTARGTVRSTAGPKSMGGEFTLEGSATDRDARLTLLLASLPLETFDAYLAQSLIPRLGGRLSANARLDWSQSPSAESGLVLTLDSGTVDALTLRGRDGRESASSAGELATLTRLTLADTRIDVPARAVTVGRLTFEEPSLSLARGKDGQWDVDRWFAATAAGSAAAPLPVAPQAAPWRVLLRDALLTGGRFQFADAQPTSATAADPVRLAVDDLHIAVQNLAWEGNRPTVPAQIELSGRVGLPSAPTRKAPASGGAFGWRGVVGVSPLLATGSLKLERIPVHLFMPYVTAALPLRLAQAELGYSGNLSVRQLPAGLDVDAGADVLLGAVRVEAAPSALPRETLLSWNTLGLKTVRLSMKPGAKPQVDIAEAALDNFYSRLVITEDGKLNLSSVATTAGPVTEVPVASSAPSSAKAAGGELPIDFRLDGTRLTNGRIDFSDHFVRPNYSAALTELNGRLGPLRSDSSEMAALSLQGKAAGTALLDISGKVNPVARPLTLDLHAKATDLELAPLSPYAGKYAGYAIERGKLSMDVAYRLGADGRLDAKNQVTLHQLTFGAKIDSPTATRLPVMLAVALLKDRNGVIDLDLPISGSLDDPQFSVSGIIGRLLGNLLVKALTSPFALLTSGSGAAASEGDPGQIEFVPGTSRLTAAGLAAVDKVAQALAEKPNLLLTVTGTVDPQAEQAAYRSAVLDDQLEAARRKATVASAAAASAPAPPLGTEARARLLKDLYQSSDLPDKPRNVLGFAKDVPAAEMERRLEASLNVGTDTMRELALQRGVSVRDALMAKGLASERLFLSAPRLESAQPGAAAAWVPKAQLSLTVN